MSIEEICNSITKVMDSARAPFSNVPAFLLACGSVNRPGLSAMNVASKIIQRQAEAGAPIGAAADGSRNISEAMERIRVEEVFNALKMDSRVQIGIPIGGIQIMATGANAGGPVVSNGFNVNYCKGEGIIS